MKKPASRWIRGGLIGVGVIAVALILWQILKPGDLPEGIVSGNGRIEAEEVDIAARSPGRIREILAREGDVVEAGQIIARMDMDTTTAQRAEAIARRQQAMTSVAAAEAQIAQRLSERASAQAVVRQRQAELSAARRRLARSATLAAEGATPAQERDDDEARVEASIAVLEAARAQLASVDAAVATARAQAAGARSDIEAVDATIRRIDVDIADGDLKAPRAGRVQYRVAQPGEVLGAGGRVLNLVDLSDVYMTFFLPTEAAGRAGIGSEVRIVLDAAPDTAIPARITFVADVAQFTPKTVETQSERQRLMFRVKATIDPDWLKRNASHVKTGLPGAAYVRTDPNVAWPDRLAVAAR